MALYLFLIGILIAWFFLIYKTIVDHKKSNSRLSAMRQYHLTVDTIFDWHKKTSNYANVDDFYQIIDNALLIKFDDKNAQTKYNKINSELIELYRTTIPEFRKAYRIKTINEILK